MQVLNIPIDPLAATMLYEVQCQECSAMIRFARSEAETQVENVTATILTITCPVCTTVVSKTINKQVTEKLVIPEKYNLLPL